MMPLPYQLITKERVKMGLIVLQSDESIEAEIDLLISRVPSGASVTPESLREMATVLTSAASLFPVSAEFSVVGYGCTSGTAQIGVAQIASLISAGTKTDRVTEPVSALIAACKALGVRNIGLISPYVASVSQTLRALLQDNGITVTAFASFDQPEENKVARIAPKSIADAAVNLAQTTDCDAVFLSCTNLRTLDIIALVEAATGIPVLSSNQVLLAHATVQRPREHRFWPRSLER